MLLSKLFSQHRSVIASSRTLRRGLPKDQRNISIELMQNFFWVSHRVKNGSNQSKKPHGRPSFSIDFCDDSQGRHTRSEGGAEIV
jgi:hypothetical protein